MKYEASKNTKATLVFSGVVCLVIGLLSGKFLYHEGDPDNSYPRFIGGMIIIGVLLIIVGLTLKKKN